jgi:DNA invertase Pin-like site-specific DNA recombinase
LLVEELQALGIALVSLGESIDATTPAGRLQFHVFSAVAQFERDRIRERVGAGLDRVKREGKRLGRPERHVPDSTLAPVRGLPIREAARRLGVSAATAHRWLSQKTSSEATLQTR